MAEEPQYDAFLSYSHALNQRLAPAVQNELQSFAKPWYRRRSLRIFRDRTSLSADPGLWSTIERGLRASRWFILLASPEAARSQWVAKEVDFWLREKSADTMLIVLAGGELAWRGDDIDWSRTDALPEVLRSAFREEPHWVDLSWLSDAEQVDRANPRFRECIADLAAPLRGMSKDELVGEHIQHHRRNLRTAWGAVSALAVLLVVALVATAVAVHQGNVAAQQADLAQERANIATARLLASASSQRIDTQLDLSQLLAVEAHRMRPGTDSSAALLQAVTANPQLVGYLPAGGRATDLATRGGFLAASTEDGRIRRWTVANVRESRPAEVATELRNPVQFAISEDGERAAVTDGNAVVVADFGTKKTVRLGSGQAVHRIALSPDGRLLAVHEAGPLDASGGFTGELVLHDAVTGAELKRVRSPLSAASMLEIPDAATVLVGLDTGQSAALSLPDLAVGSTVEGYAPFNNYTATFSPGGKYYGFVKFSSWNLFAAGPWTEREPVTLPEPSVPTRMAPAALAVAADGQRAAVASSGRVYVTQDGAAARLELPGNSQVDVLEFAEDDRWLAAVVGDSVVVWDLDQTDRFAHHTGVVLEDLSLFPSRPGLDVASGRLVTGLPEDGPLSVVDLRDDNFAQLPNGWETGFSAVRPIWLRDELLLVDDLGAARLVSGAEPFTTRAEWAAPASGMTGSPSPALTVAEIPGDRVVMVDREGRIVVRAVRDGAVLQDIGRQGWPQWPADDARQATAAVRPDGASVALADENAGVLIVDLATERATALPGAGAEDVEFAPDGRLIVQRTTGPVEVWDAGRLQLERILAASDLAGDDLAVSPDGRYVAGIRSDGGVVVLELASGQRFGVLPLPAPGFSWSGEIGDTSGIAFGADSRELFSVTAGGELLRWPLDPQEWIRRACATAGRDLTPQEWRQVVGTEPPADLRCMR
ncbi:hypothetical protein AB0I53_27990 [Saccharopolyspora sp. NPDC050389]|uniref:hypothetical protein n=1 Tax=Saccharopolyspora sp. NPDC050389 TaxID=3155516 RepID=UPI0033D16187